MHARRSHLLTVFLTLVCDFLQLCTIPVVAVVILVLLFIARLFYHLPKVSW